MTKTEPSTMVKSLSFEVITTQEPANGYGANDAKVKIRLKRKDNPNNNNAIVSIRRHGSGHKLPENEKIHLAASDQTIMSFNILVESDTEILTGNENNEKTVKSQSKPRRRSMLSLLKSGKDDDCKIKHTIKRTRKYGRTNFFGKCKPGGCLDPSVDEEINPYELTKPVKSKASSAQINKLSLDENKSKVTNTFENQDGSSVLHIFQGEPSQNYDTSKSNSMITYPPAVTISELNGFNESSKGNSERNSLNKKPDINTKDIFEDDDVHYFRPKRESESKRKSSLFTAPPIIPDLDANNLKDKLVSNLNLTNNEDKIQPQEHNHNINDVEINTEGDTANQEYIYPLSNNDIEINPLSDKKVDEITCSRESIRKEENEGTKILVRGIITVPEVESSQIFTESVKNQEEFTEYLSVSPLKTECQPKDTITLYESQLTDVKSIPIYPQDTITLITKRSDIFTRQSNKAIDGELPLKRETDTPSNKNVAHQLSPHLTHKIAEDATNKSKNEFEQNDETNTEARKENLTKKVNDSRDEVNDIGEYNKLNESEILKYIIDKKEDHCGIKPIGTVMKGNDYQHSVKDNRQESIPATPHKKKSSADINDPFTDRRIGLRDGTKLIITGDENKTTYVKPLEAECSDKSGSLLVTPHIKENSNDITAVDTKLDASDETKQAITKYKNVEAHAISIEKGIEIPHKKQRSDDGISNSIDSKLSPCYGTNPFTTKDNEKSNEKIKDYSDKDHKYEAIPVTPYIKKNSQDNDTTSFGGKLDACDETKPITIYEKNDYAHVKPFENEIKKNDIDNEYIDNEKKYGSVPAIPQIREYNDSNKTYIDSNINQRDKSESTIAKSKKESYNKPKETDIKDNINKYSDIDNKYASIPVTPHTKENSYDITTVDTKLDASDGTKQAITKDKNVEVNATSIEKGINIPHERQQSDVGLNISLDSKLSPPYGSNLFITKDKEKSNEKINVYSDKENKYEAIPVTPYIKKNSEDNDTTSFGRKLYACDEMKPITSNEKTDYVHVKPHKNETKEKDNEYLDNDRKFGSLPVVPQIGENNDINKTYIDNNLNQCDESKSNITEDKTESVYTKSKDKEYGSIPVTDTKISAHDETKPIITKDKNEDIYVKSLEKEIKGNDNENSYRSNRYGSKSETNLKKNNDIINEDIIDSKFGLSGESKSIIKKDENDYFFGKSIENKENTNEYSDKDIKRESISVTPQIRKHTEVNDIISIDSKSSLYDAPKSTVTKEKHADHFEPEINAINNDYLGKDQEYGSDINNRYTINTKSGSRDGINSIVPKDTLKDTEVKSIKEKIHENTDEYLGRDMQDTLHMNKDSEDDYNNNTASTVSKMGSHDETKRHNILNSEEKYKENDSIKTDIRSDQHFELLKTEPDQMNTIVTDQIYNNIQPRLENLRKISKNEILLSEKQSAMTYIRASVNKIRNSFIGLRKSLSKSSRTTLNNSITTDEPKFFDDVLKISEQDILNTKDEEFSLLANTEKERKDRTEQCELNQNYAEQNEKENKIKSTEHVTMIQQENEYSDDIVIPAQPNRYLINKITTNNEDKVFEPDIDTGMTREVNLTPRRAEPNDFNVSEAIIDGEHLKIESIVKITNNKLPVSEKQSLTDNLRTSLTNNRGSFRDLKKTTSKSSQITINDMIFSTENSATLRNQNNSIAGKEFETTLDEENFVKGQQYFKAIETENKRIIDYPHLEVNDANEKTLMTKHLEEYSDEKDILEFNISTNTISEPHFKPKQNNFHVSPTDLSHEYPRRESIRKISRNESQISEKKSRKDNIASSINKLRSSFTDLRKSLSQSSRSIMNFSISTNEPLEGSVPRSNAPEDPIKFSQDEFSVIYESSKIPADLPNTGNDYDVPLSKTDDKHIVLKNNEIFDNKTDSVIREDRLVFQPLGTEASLNAHDISVRSKSSRVSFNNRAITIHTKNSMDDLLASYINSDNTEILIDVAFTTFINQKNQTVIKSLDAANTLEFSEGKVTYKKTVVKPPQMEICLEMDFNNSLYLKVLKKAVDSPARTYSSKEDIHKAIAADTEMQLDLASFSLYEDHMNSLLGVMQSMRQDIAMLSDEQRTLKLKYVSHNEFKSNKVLKKESTYRVHHSKEASMMHVQNFLRHAFQCQCSTHRG